MITEAEFRRLGQEGYRGVASLLKEVHAELVEYGEPDEVTRRREVRQFGLVQGVLWAASGDLVEFLFEEYDECLGAAVSGTAWDWESAAVCGGLPGRFADHYTPRFVRQLILAAGAVTARLTGEWSAPVSVIEEIAVRLLIGQCEVVVDTYEVKLDAGWRDELESLLLEDLDVEMLYEEDVDDAALADECGQSYLPQRWCLPFGDAANQAPYVTGEPDPAR